MSTGDEIYVHIYSDKYDQSQTCGKYSFLPVGTIDFGGLQIICDEVILIAVVEDDMMVPGFNMNDAYTTIVPCGGSQTNIYDVVIAKSTLVQRVSQTMVDVTEQADKVKGVFTLIGAP